MWSLFCESSSGAILRQFVSEPPSCSRLARLPMSPAEKAHQYEPLRVNKTVPALCLDQNQARRAGGPVSASVISSDTSIQAALEPV